MLYFKYNCQKQVKSMEFRFSKNIYPKSALIKSAYNFTDKAYLHLDEDQSDYIVNIIFKDDNKFDYHEFENEMLTQTVRYEVYRQTKDIRKLTVARALASTIVEELPDYEEFEDENIDINNILKDWFDENE